MGEGPASPIPPGYVTDGLVFFLDGKQADAAIGQWRDLIRGRTFVLTDCTAAGSGVSFNGTTSCGVCHGAITSDWANETIETAFASGMTSTKNILNQPYTKGSVGISLRLSANGSSQRVGLGLDGVTRTVYYYRSSVNLLSARKDCAVGNLQALSATTNLGSSKNETDSTVIGAGIYGVEDPSVFFNGTIYAIRIYNRHLTEAEMQQNQLADAERYGITI